MEGVAHNLGTLDETQGDQNLLIEDNPGAGETLRGCGSASLVECFGRMGTQSNASAPATRVSGEDEGGASSLHTDPCQVASPNLSQILPQDSSQVRDAPRVDTRLRPDDLPNKCKDEETPATEPKREQYDVSWFETRWNCSTKSTSQLPQEQSADPEHNTYYQDTSHGPSEAPWIYVINELRSIQFAFEQLSTKDPD